ncbi:MAG TPA: cation-translocating P-type ATPase [Candidatus Acidoferrum sp.]|nr:cation-translocating P-type ATPase [Candidatus Acidoferrum sp.]
MSSSASKPRGRGLLEAGRRKEAASSGHAESEHEHAQVLNWRELNRVFFVAAAAGALWFLRGESSAYVTGIGVACTLVGAFPIFAEAFENIVQRRMTMELSMVIAIVAALVIREVFTALVITLFVLVAEILEGLTVGRGRQAMRRLIDLLPNAATVRQRGDWKDVGIDEITPGDEVLVRPGTRIPVDGKVVGGHSFVDEASITGESMPVEKIAGGNVHAGTINQSGALEIRVERLGRDTTFGKIIEAVERAEKSRAPIQGIADRLAGYLVYFALTAAAITFLITHNPRSTISVVIVAGACGIAAGTPLAILGAIGRAAQDGAIIKGGLYVEKLAEIDTILLDKTGTLTYGKPEVMEIRPADGVTAACVMEAAAIAEFQSEHPVAKAILTKATQMGIHFRQPDRFHYTPGRGIVAEIGGEEIAVGSWMHLRDERIQGADATHGTSDGAVLVTRAGHLLGSIHVADLLRPEARTAIESLKSMGLKTILLTGDSKAVAEAVGKGLGVDEISAELLPEQKLQRVEQLLARGNKVVMVGDGINDAPALAQATVGVAMGSGTDVARESSDIVLIGSDLTKFAATVRLARRCRGIIVQNFGGTLLVDSVGICLAAAGFLNPLLAASIHVCSELAFILNSARLLPSSASAVK